MAEYLMLSSLALVEAAFVFFTVHMIVALVRAHIDRGINSTTSMILTHGAIVLPVLAALHRVIEWHL
jgi:hypothetical protein